MLSEFCHPVLPIRAWTGITPRPQVTNPESAFRSRLSFPGTVTKNHGASPCQNRIVPLNSMFMGTVSQRRSCPGIVMVHFPCSPGNRRGLCIALFRREVCTYSPSVNSVRVLFQPGGTKSGSRSRPLSPRGVCTTNWRGLLARVCKCDLEGQAGLIHF